MYKKLLPLLFLTFSCQTATQYFQALGAIKDTKEDIKLMYREMDLLSRLYRIRYYDLIGLPIKKDQLRPSDMINIKLCPQEANCFVRWPAKKYVDDLIKPHFTKLDNHFTDELENVAFANYEDEVESWNSFMNYLKDTFKTIADQYAQQLQNQNNHPLFVQKR